MKEKQLREHAVCSICRELIGNSGLPLFWTVTVERHSIRMDAVRRQNGLAWILGGSIRLAMAMGIDEEMTLTMLGPLALTVCETCAVVDHSLAGLAECSVERAKEADGEK